MKSSKNAGSIVAINKVTQTIYGLSGNELFEHDFHKSNRKQETYVSYIPFKDIMTTTVEIGRNVEDADLLDTIVVKVYEELGLDTALDYKITYNEVIGASGDDRVFNIFVVNSEILKTEFDAIAARTGYIDYVALAPFLYDSLYKRNILTPEATDCFIYLQREDAFLVVYQNGEYFQARQVRYNLKFLNDKFSELVGNRLDEDSFGKLLSQQGINLENPTERDCMIQIFDDMFYYLNDLIAGINKIYNIKIQNIYFGTDIGKIPGVEAFVENTLNLTYKDFNFSVAINMKEFNLTQLDVLMFLAAQEYNINKDDEHNYSPFLRPPPLSQRYSGKLFAYLALGALVGMAYPLYQYGEGYYMSMQSETKKAEFSISDRQLQDAKKDKEMVTQQLTGVRDESVAEGNILTERRNLLNEIHSIKVDYPMKSKAIYDITNMVLKNKGTIVRIGDVDRNLTVQVQTKNDKQMTELLRDISVVAPYAVYTKAIAYQSKDNSVFYDSNISVEIQHEK